MCKTLNSGTPFYKTLFNRACSKKNNFTEMFPTFLVLLLLPPVSSDCFCSQYDSFADCDGKEACPIGKPIVTVQCWIRHIATNYQIQKLRIRGDCPLGEIYEKLCPNEYIQELHSIKYNSTRICQG